MCSRPCEFEKYGCKDKVHDMNVYYIGVTKSMQETLDKVQVESMDKVHNIGATGQSNVGVTEQST